MAVAFPERNKETRTFRASPERSCFLRRVFFRPAFSSSGRTTPAAMSTTATTPPTIRPVEEPEDGGVIVGVTEGAGVGVGAPGDGVTVAPGTGVGVAVWDGPT